MKKKDKHSPPNTTPNIPKIKWQDSWNEKSRRRWLQIEVNFWI